MVIRRIVGVLWLQLGLVSASGASAEVLFMSETNNAAANASASAGGYAFASGDVGRASTRFHAHANFNASSVNDGTGGISAWAFGWRRDGLSDRPDALRASPARRSRQRRRDANKYVRRRPTITMTTTTTTETTTTTTTTRIEAFEALTATASDFEDMTSQFASPSQATFTFSGYASAAFRGHRLSQDLHDARHDNDRRNGHEDN